VKIVRRIFVSITGGAFINEWSGDLEAGLEISDENISKPVFTFTSLGVKNSRPYKLLWTGERRKKSGLRHAAEGSERAYALSNRAINQSWF